MENKQDGGGCGSVHVEETEIAVKIKTARGERRKNSIRNRGWKRRKSWKWRKQTVEETYKEKDV